jgi:Holliday junction resolvase
MKGKVFEHEISASLKEIAGSESYFFYRRLLDSHMPGVRVPADFLVIHAGTPYFLECKSSKDTSFPIRNVKDTQLQDMNDAEVAGAKSYILIKHSCRSPKVYALRVREWMKLVKGLDRKSVTWDMLDKKAVHLLKTEWGTWNLMGLFVCDY